MGKKISKSVRKQIISIAFLVVLVALTIIILCLSNRELDFASIGDFLRSCNPWYIAIAFGCMLLFIFLEALSLHVISHTLGHKCKLRSSIVYSTSDVYYSAITPSAAGGQPASAYYMMQDGMSGGTATFALVFNLIAYTGSIIILGVAAFVLDAIGALGLGMFVHFRGFVKFLIIAGLVFQSLLLAFFVACMFCSGTILKCGNAGITLLHKMHIIKKVEKWRGKMEGVVDKYRGSLTLLGKHKLLFAVVLLITTVQRASQMLVTCFVCMAGAGDASFLDLFVMQAFVTLGYNFVPLPGGVGAFEYLYLNIFTFRFDKSFILVAMMITRVISYYISMIICGVITLTYHGILTRRKRAKALAEEAAMLVKEAEEEERQGAADECFAPELSEESESPKPELAEENESLTPKLTEKGESLTIKE